MGVWRAVWMEGVHNQLTQLWVVGWDAFKLPLSDLIKAIYDNVN